MQTKTDEMWHDSSKTIASWAEFLKLLKRSFCIVYPQGTRVNITALQQWNISKISDARSKTKPVLTRGFIKVRYKQGRASAEAAMSMNNEHWRCCEDKMAQYFLFRIYN